MRFVDPNGCEFTENAWEWVNRLNNTNSKLEEVRGEIGVLAASSQKYDIERGSTSNGYQGITTYNADNDAVKMIVDGTMGTLAHELKHAYQFETGELSYVIYKKQMRPGTLYDYQDEVEAHARGGLFGAGSTPDPTRYAELKQYRYKSLSIKTIKPAKEYYRINGHLHKP